MKKNMSLGKEISRAEMKQVAGGYRICVVFDESGNPTSNFNCNGSREDCMGVLQPSRGSIWCAYNEVPQ